MTVIAHAADLVSTLLAGVPMLVAGGVLAWQKLKARRAHRRGGEVKPAPPTDVVSDEKSGP